MSVGNTAVFLLCASLAALVHAQDKMPQIPSGPSAQRGKTVVYIASDYKNGGVMGVFRGFEEASRQLGWKVRIEDGHGQKNKLADILSRAVDSRPDGIIFGGFGPDDFASQVTEAKRRQIVLLGWHAAQDPGPTKDLFVNVSTKPDDVAKMAAEFVIQDAKANQLPVGVVIFTDKQFAVANAKTEAMRKTLQVCAGYTGCQVLSVENVPISAAASEIPKIVPELVARHGAKWTYSLAINDIYFDEMNYPLRWANRRDIRNVSAGDGSSKALARIGAGVSQQIATVAEPLQMQGYQLADELNRALAGQAPSGFQSKPVLIRAKSPNPADRQGNRGTAGFEAAYAAIWSK